MASQHWKFRQHWNGSFHFDPQAQEGSSSDSDTCGSSHASGWEAASSSAPSPHRTRQINRQRREHSNPWRGPVRRGGGRVYFHCDSSSSSGAEETMTSASELLYQRRSRMGRSPELQLPEAASRRLRSSSSNIHSHRRSNHYDPSYHHYYCHRSLRLRNSLQQVPEGDDQSQFSEHTSTSSMHNDETGHVRNRLMGTFYEQAAENNSLRGEIMQARERLYQRFRAASLVGNRHNIAASTGTEIRYYFSEDPILSDDGLTEADWNRVVSRNRLYGEDLEVEIYVPREPKPQGLNQKGISNLQRELFEPRSTAGSKESKEAKSSLEQEDCPVCLEHFLPGEQLIRLACRHRFHPVCLTPWLKICGECPYCRANVLQDHGPSISKS
ncbi:hypothetical protein SUGI_0903660 [Cryptomeria japonica]|uniref:probable E3 ubiquitin-protein ligase RHY1A isoform X2 n=1 Tax=Cryptomeria japonica TaxID=3369 RepID=UPI0024149893|nr:probable E3 ubiquitin-protein ligase RHY1A isoform X2 [Cryptomeria japonica]GLJ43463.1 hypothetical protein SUGI_0903660 [Cryptomeria japonica]